MTNRDWNGARWWKFDFHAHTPASRDYGGKVRDKEGENRRPEDWLLDYMRAGIDCVAVTDHNTGAWVDELKVANKKLESEQPEGYRPIQVFPGVEINVHGEIHLLAIFGPDKSTADIDALLGAIGFPSQSKGLCDAVTKKSFGEVVAAIDSAGGIAIPAHVDRPKGLWKQSGTTLGQILDSPHLFAMEVVDSRSSKPGQYSEKKVDWTQVVGSDAHHPEGTEGQNYPGSRFTWVKMGSPSLEGLRLALLDGALSVRRSDDESADPNRHAPSVLDSLEVTKAHYIGRNKPFTVKLNPWLNCVIGGRGTGKSTLVEFLRLTLRRENELPDYLENEFEKYREVRQGREESGLLTKDTLLHAVYRKDGNEFKVQWSTNGELDPILLKQNGGWTPAEGDVAQRFPVRIYSQKQIFHLAKKPLSLLKQVVDRADGVDYRSWSERWKEEEAKYLSLRSKIREIEIGITDEPKMRGELDDVKHKLEVFEKAGHTEVLKNFQRRSLQERTVETWEGSWVDVGDQITELADDLTPAPMDTTRFDPDSKEDRVLLEEAETARKELEDMSKALKGLAAQAEMTVSKWQSKKEASPWRNAANEAKQAYEDLRKKLEREEAGDPSAYGDLVQRRQTIEQRIKKLAVAKKQTEALEEQARHTLQRLLRLRKELTESRRKFLKKVLEGNKFVRIEVRPYQDREGVEPEFRRFIQREEGRYKNEIGRPGGGGLLGRIYEGDPSPKEIENRLEELKTDLRGIARRDTEHPTPGKRFSTHLEKLPPEAFDRLDTWFPEDSLDVQYSKTGDGKNFTSIREGSPGQKTAALLAFILSYGEEPLILDQPEDDLDNHLIYELIVAQIRHVKKKRQIIIVTHNPNIVVNGDAELVVALHAKKGQTVVECEGSLQEKPVRDTICDVMEGGREAFKRRYRRIALEGRNV